MFIPKFFFREKDDGAGGAPPATDPATPPATPPTSGADEVPAGTLPKDGKGTGEEIRFTPSALKERLDRAQNTAKAELAKSLGFETVEAMQTAVEEGQKAIREKMTEQERIQADLVAEREKTQVATARAEQLAQEATQAKLEAAALGLMAGKFADPKLALRLVNMKDVDLTDPTFKGLETAINQLAETAPWTLIQNAGNGQRRTLAPPLGSTNPETSGKKAGKTDDELRQKYFGGGVKESSFFKGGGVVGGSPNQRIGGG